MLITLGVIGIVAAMTIPTLIANMTGARYRSQFKKAVSTLSQAARLNKANYGWDFADVNTGCYGSDFQKETSENTMSICAILNSNLSSKQGFILERDLKDMVGYKQNGTSVGVTLGGVQYTVYSLADGTLIGVRSISFSKGCTLPIGARLGELLKNPANGGYASMHSCTGFIDVNGLSLPNEETKCSTGTTSKDVDVDCIVKTKDIKDIFPVVFHDSIVEGATNAARYVLQTTK